MVVSDLKEIESRLARHEILVGRANDLEVRFKPFGKNIMIAGTSGGASRARRLPRPRSVPSGKAPAALAAYGLPWD